MRTTPPSRVPLVTGVLLVLIAIALGAAGIWLIRLGGSWYYVVAAVGLMLTGLLLITRRAAALWVYALLVAGTLGWALWETGLDWWPLAARMDVFFLIGLFLLTPWVTRSLGSLVEPQPQPSPALPSRSIRDGSAVGRYATVAPLPQRTRTSAFQGSGLVLTLTLFLFVVVAIASRFHDPHKLPGKLGPVPASSPRVVTPALTAAADATLPDDWPVYGRTGFGQRYSPLAQITPANVAGLKVAWQYQTGDSRGREGGPNETTFEVTPLKVGNRLFLCTPHQSVIALDATNGAELWRYNPEIQGQLALQHLTCRGLSYQPAEPGANMKLALSPMVTMPPALALHSGSAKSKAAAKATAQAGSQNTNPASSAAQRSTAQSVSPAPVLSPEAVASLPGIASNSAPGARTSGNDGQPIAAKRGALISSCTARVYLPTADGRLIALNPDTGAVCASFGGGKGQIDLWANMPNPKPGSYYSTSPVVLARGLIIVGGSVLDNVSTQKPSGVVRAFNAETGALVWNWDSGSPEATAPIAPGQRYTANSPNSWSISSVDEVLGMVYVPMGNQSPDEWGGKRSAAVEKYSSALVALDLGTGKVRWSFQTVRHDLWDYDVPAQPSLIDLNINSTIVPALVQPTKQGELFVLDRRTGLPVIPVTEVPAPQGTTEGDHTALTQPQSALSFNPRPLTDRDMWGATMFDQMACRIAFRRLRYEGRFTPPSEQGSLIYPGNFGVFNWGGIAVDPQRQIAFTAPNNLAFVSRLIRRPDDTALVAQGKERLKGSLPALNENFGAPSGVKHNAFLSPLGIPCQAPPWGYVAGADLQTGKIVWRHKNGTVRDLSPLPLPFKMGVPSLGGPIMTGGGVAFLSGTLDYFVRAYDVSTGEQLWQSRLPAGGQATPMTYTGNDGRQYLLVIAGGHGPLGTKAGDYVLAYALPM